MELLILLTPFCRNFLYSSKHFLTQIKVLTFSIHFLLYGGQDRLMGFNARVGTETPEKKTGSEKSAQCK